jgi:hypothetical protein
VSLGGDPSASRGFDHVALPGSSSGPIATPLVDASLEWQAGGGGLAETLEHPPAAIATETTPAASAPPQTRARRVGITRFYGEEARAASRPSSRPPLRAHGERDEKNVTLRDSLPLRHLADP